MKLIKKNKNEKKKIKKPKHIILIIILGLFTFILGAVLVFILYIIISAPEFDRDRLYNQSSSTLLDINGNEFARLGAENRELVTYDQLPQVLVDAIVATEDSRFFQHNGFDGARFVKATIGQLTGHSNAGGASTLTMQVAKNTYTNSNARGMTLSGITRKLTDIYMAMFKIEKNYTKEEIIEFYVNYPWLGSDSWGVEQTSLHYFGKSVSDLSLPEAALIAGLFNNPIYLNPYTYPEAATNRRNVVLDLMYRHGYITEEQRDDAKAISVESLLIPNTGKSLNKYQTFIDTVVEEIKKDTGMDPYVTPMEIATTMDPKIQDVMVSLNNGELYKFKDDIVQIALVITDTNTGAITAVNGGRNQTAELAFNRATQMSKQPGSTAKPIFDYGPLIEYKNASTGQYFWDDPMTYSNGSSLSNADRSYQGMETMRTALANSRNIPAVQAFQQLEPEKIASFVHSLGIDYGDNLYESYAIGGGFGASPLELAAAYGAFARGGYYIEPYSYTKITFKTTGDELNQKIKREKVMSEETAYMINSMLMTAQRNYVGWNGSISGTDVAAKTGTSTYDLNALRAKGIPLSASADNWNITYSPDNVIVLWYGYDKLYEKPYYTDSNAAAGVRKTIMGAVAKRVYKQNSTFKVPSGITSVEVEKNTVPLALPSAYTPQDMRMTELFKVGTEPNEISNRYDQLPSPTNGSASTTGTSITLTWDKVTSDATNPETLKTYFTENYGKFADSYYNKRLAYNSSYIGDLGYQIYLKGINGSLTPLGYTTNPYYTYETNGIGGDYTFVVKSAYSIFKDNMSEGLEISSSAKGNVKISYVSLNSSSESYTISDNKITANNLKKALTITDSNGDNIDPTKQGLVTLNIKNTSTSRIVSEIDLSKAGVYEVEYSISGYSQKLTKTITVS